MEASDGVSVRTTKVPPFGRPPVFFVPERVVYFVSFDAERFEPMCVYSIQFNSIQFNQRFEPVCVYSIQFNSIQSVQFVRSRPVEAALMGSRGTLGLERCVEAGFLVSATPRQQHPCCCGIPYRFRPSRPVRRRACRPDHPFPSGATPYILLYRVARRSRT